MTSTVDGRKHNQWAADYIGELLAGRYVRIRPNGHSMAGRIAPGQLCSLVPVGEMTLQVGDVVLCTVGGRHLLHAIISIDGERYTIGDTRGRVDGVIGRDGIFGKCQVLGEAETV